MPKGGTFQGWAVTVKVNIDGVWEAVLVSPALLVREGQTRAGPKTRPESTVLPPFPAVQAI